MSYIRDQQTFSLKGQIVNVNNFVGQIISFTTLPTLPLGMKAAIERTEGMSLAIANLFTMRRWVRFDLLAAVCWPLFSMIPQWVEPQLSPEVTYSITTHFIGLSFFPVSLSAHPCMCCLGLPTRQTPFPQFLFSWPALGEPDWEARTVLFNAIFRQADDVAKWWALWRVWAAVGSWVVLGKGLHLFVPRFLHSVSIITEVTRKCCYEDFVLNLGKEECVWYSACRYNEP